MASPPRYSLLAGRLDGACRRAVAAVAPIVKGGAADLCVLAGLSAICYGLGLFSKPAAWIFGGVVCIVIGLRGLQAPPAGGA